jgi:hypothetical protein
MEEMEVEVKKLLVQFAEAGLGQVRIWTRQARFDASALLPTFWGSLASWKADFHCKHCIFVHFMIDL